MSCPVNHEEIAAAAAAQGGCPAGHGRRSFMKTALGAGAAGAVLAGGGIALTAGQAQADDGSAGQAPAVDFHGDHQAGIVTPNPAASTFVSFDVVARDRAGLTELLKTITERARFLTKGGTPADLGVGAPPADNGIIGPVLPADALTVTVGVGASLFDDRFGLAKAKPHKLTPMRTFPNDNLRPAECHGDLSLQICADSTDTVLHALRDIAKHTRGAMQIKWRIDGFANGPRPSGAQRNLLGFKDGIANPDVKSARETDRLIWVTDSTGEPSWAVGGSYQVIRIIRMLVEFWDRVSLSEQELMFGRRKDTGAPLDGVKRDRHPRLRQGPAGQRHPPGRPHPARQPAHRQDRRHPHPAPRLQLRPRRRLGRQPRHGPGLLLLPAGRPPPVRSHPDPPHRRAPRRLHLPDRRRLLLLPPRRQGRQRLAGAGADVGVGAGDGSPVTDPGEALERAGGGRTHASACRPFARRGAKGPVGCLAVRW